MGVPNSDQWAKVFNATFKELDKRVLAPHVRFGIEYKAYKLKGEAMFRCRQSERCKTWHSYVATVDMTYGLKKKGKPKKRIGEVKLKAYGQKCRICNKIKKGGDGDEDKNQAAVEERYVFLQPCFLPHSIDSIIDKVFRSVVLRFYTEKDETGNLPDLLRQILITGDPAPPNAYSRQRPSNPPPTTLIYPSFVANDDGSRGSEENEDFVEIQIGRGQHNSELCEGCESGECAKALQRADGEDGSQRRRYSSSYSRIGGSISVPLPPDPKSLPTRGGGEIYSGDGANKVRWYLVL